MSSEKPPFCYDEYLILPGRSRLVLAENIALKSWRAVTPKFSALTINCLYLQQTYTTLLWI